MLVCRLGGNELGDDGAVALGKALSKSKVSKLEELDLEYNQIGVDGAKALAAFCAVSGSLTKIDVRYNLLGDDGEAALRKVVEGRSGFELML